MRKETLGHLQEQGAAYVWGLGGAEALQEQKAEPGNFRIHLMTTSVDQSSHIQTQREL